MHERIRHILLGRWARLVSDRPVTVLVIALLVATGCVALAATRMGFESNRNELIAEHLEWNQRFAQWQRGFPGASDLLVIVDSEAGLPQEATDEQVRQGRERAEAAVDELARRLAGASLVRQAVHGFDAAGVSPKAMRLLPMDEFKAQLQRLRQSVPVLESTTPTQLLTDQPIDPQAFTPESIRRGAEMLDAWREILADPDAVLDAGPGEATPLDRLLREEAGLRYLTSENGRLYYLRITPQAEAGSLSALDAAIEQVRGILADTRGDFPQVEMGLTGIEVVEGDETDAATRDSAIASALAALLIAVLLVLAFQSWRTPLMLMAALLVGIAWTFGFLTLSIGYLQVISVVFTVILLGIGIGFGIHLAAHIELVRHEHPDSKAGFADALGRSLEVVGPGVFTGAVTTSAAFCTTLFTDFTGVAEMGLIAAVGIMLCLLAMVSVFPALLRLVKPGHDHFVPMAHRWVHFFEEKWVMPFVRRPRTTLAVAAGLTLLAGVGVTQMRFDYNLLKLLPRGIDSIKWQQRLVEDGGQSIWFGISLAEDLEEARTLALRFRGLDSVSDVGGIGLLFPQDHQEKLEMIGAVREQVAGALSGGLSGALDEVENPTPETVRKPVEADDALVPAVRRLRTQLSVAGWLPGLGDRLAPLREAAGRFIEQAESMDRDELTRGLRAVQLGYLRFRLEMAKTVREAIDPAPLTLDDVPALLADSFTGKVNGETVYALEVYPELPAGVDDPLEPGFLSRFVRDMERVDSQITGVIVQVYKSGDLIQRSYQLAGLLAVVIVLVLVWLDFRSLADALLALVPVVVGFTLTFGLLWALGMSINPANIIVLPLMFGIGVDAGVHVLHRFRMNPTEPPPGLVRGTGKGITVTSLTTIIAFACMITARHRGIASLGFVLATGITLTLLACWTLMPAWLTLRSKRRA